MTIEPPPNPPQPSVNILGQFQFCLSGRRSFLTLSGAKTASYPRNILMLSSEVMYYNVVWIKLEDPLAVSSLSVVISLRMTLFSQRESVCRNHPLRFPWLGSCYFLNVSILDLFWTVSQPPWPMERSLGRWRWFCFQLRKRWDIWVWEWSSDVGVHLDMFNIITVMFHDHPHNIPDLPRCSVCQSLCPGKVHAKLSQWVPFL